MLKNFEIENFRCFKELKVSRFGRVNLIVGKNNTGKTTLLEAMQLYAANDWATQISPLLEKHDEVRSGQLPQFRSELRIEALFNRNRQINGDDYMFSVGETGVGDNLLEIKLVRLRERVDAQGRTSYEEFTDGDEKAFAGPPLQRGLKAKRSKRSEIWSLTSFNFAPNRDPSSRALFVAPGDPLRRQTQEWWDAISLRSSENRIINALQSIAPIRKLSLVRSPLSDSDRVFQVALDNDNSPTPLRSLGEGVGRMLQIVVAAEFSGLLTDTQNSMGMLRDSLRPSPDLPKLLLIDEIENGIHYTVLPELWKFIFHAAKLLDVQVFATSHSWDCVEAFQLAAKEAPESDAVMVRLERKGDKTRAVVFDEHDLSVITRNEIEVR